MYAIVRSGGRQHKVAVGDVVEVDRVAGEPGSTLTLAALLVVDGDSVTSDAKALGNVTVTAEVVDHTKGPKIHILKYKNKTGYRKRQGHRQRHSVVKVTGTREAPNGLAPATPGYDRRVAFVGIVDELPQIFVMNGDGSRPQQLTEWEADFPYTGLAANWTTTG